MNQLANKAPVPEETYDEKELEASFKGQSDQALKAEEQRLTHLLLQTGSTIHLRDQGAGLQRRLAKIRAELERRSKSKTWLHQARAKLELLLTSFSWVAAGSSRSKLVNADHQATQDQKEHERSAHQDADLAPTPAASSSARHITPPASGNGQLSARHHHGVDDEWQPTPTPQVSPQQGRSLVLSLLPLLAPSGC